jgi:hypothetical protein
VACEDLIALRFCLLNQVRSGSNAVNSLGFRNELICVVLSCSFLSFSCALNIAELISSEERLIIQAGRVEWLLQTLTCMRKKTRARTSRDRNNMK